MIATSLEARPLCAIARFGNKAAMPARLCNPNGCGPLNDIAINDVDLAHRLPIRIDDAFVADILRPYRAHARYLKSAEITHVHDKAVPQGRGKPSSLITGMGRFSIPESCYIDHTGHFNAVEFNICFNQLAYVVF